MQRLPTRSWGNVNVIAKPLALNFSAVPFAMPGRKRRKRMRCETSKAGHQDNTRFRLELRDECGHKGSTRRNRTLTSTGICTGIADASVLCRSARPYRSVTLGARPVIWKDLAESPDLSEQTVQTVQTTDPLQTRRSSIARRAPFPQPYPSSAHLRIWAPPIGC